MNDSTTDLARRFGPLLVATMVASTFQMFVLSVLAVDVIDDLGFSRAEIGIAGSINTLVGAVTAPVTGRWTDRIGPVRSIAALFALSGAGLLIMAAAQGWILLGLSAVVSGIPQGWGNPATNSLISKRIPEGRRGVLTGIKQSGVQIAIILAGFTLPGLAALWSWRGAMVAYGTLFLVGGVVVAAFLRKDLVNASTADRQAPAKQALAAFVLPLAVYAFVMGLSGGAIGRFLALFANEELGASTALAGAITGVGGVVGVVARVVAGRVAEQQADRSRSLFVLAVVATASGVLLALSTHVGLWLLWPMIVLFGIGHAAWNSVGMLTVILGVPDAQAGRTSGFIMLGFLFGLALGSPAAGLAIDAGDSYQVVWWTSVALSAVAALIIRRARALFVSPV